MPPKIVHDDGFEIWLSHKNEWLTIYDSVEVSDSDQGEASKPTAHKKTFAGVPNKVIVQRETGAELLMIQLFIVREFDFFSGNALQSALHVVTADGDKEQAPLEAILKKTHDKKPKYPAGYACFALQGSEAHTGTVFVSLTQGTADEDTDVFTPLSGEGDEPYIVQIEWCTIDDSMKRRVTRGRQNGSYAPPPVSRKRPVKTTEPKGKESIEQYGIPSSADKTTDPTEVETTSDQASPRVQCNKVETTAAPRADSQTQTAADAESTEDPSLPIRLKEDNEANLSQAEDATTSDGAAVFTTPPTTFIGSDATPNLGSPGNGGGLKGSIVGSIPTLAHETGEIGTSTRKRSAGEVFDSDREKNLVRFAFEVEMAKADFDVDDAKVQGMTDTSSREYFSLLLEKARSHLHVVNAELESKKVQLEGKNDAEYRVLKTRKAEAQLAMLEAEGSTLVEAERNSLDFNVKKAYAEFGVAKAKVKQMDHEGRKNDVEYLRAVLKRAQANSGIALAELERKAAECGEDKDV